MIMYVNPNSLDNKGSWRILKDFYCSVTMLRELGLMFFGPFVAVLDPPPDWLMSKVKRHEVLVKTLHWFQIIHNISQIEL